MIETAATVWLISLVTFATLVLVVRQEQKRGKRYLIPGVRSWLDDRVLQAGNLLARAWEHFSKYILQLNWYYSIHSILKGILKTLFAFYRYFENIFERNRTRTKQLRAEKRQLSEYSHLQQMSDFKHETALTESQKKKLKQKHLEGK
jgi:hypothetical protein